VTIADCKCGDCIHWQPECFGRPLMCWLLSPAIRHGGCWAGITATHMKGQGHICWQTMAPPLTGWPTCQALFDELKGVREACQAKANCIAGSLAMVLGRCGSNSGLNFALLTSV